MSVFEKDLGQTLHVVADGVSLRPEEEQGILAAMRAELARAEHLAGVPRAAWRWLSATVIGVLMVFSMVGQWQQAPAVTAQACVTPEVRVTPVPAAVLIWDTPGGWADASSEALDPAAIASPRAAAELLVATGVRPVGTLQVRNQRIRSQRASASRQAPLFRSPSARMTIARTPLW